jgi:molecular chaperone DnaK
MKLGQAMYESQQAGASGAGAAGPDMGADGAETAGADAASDNQEEVVDAEFSEVDDEKRA